MDKGEEKREGSVRLCPIIVVREKRGVLSCERD